MKRSALLSLTLSIAACWCASGFGAAADEAAVAEILAAYARIDNYQATLRQQDVLDGRTVNVTAGLRYQQPYYFRADVAVQDGDAAQKSVTVFDGTALWQENYGPEGELLNVMKTSVDPASAGGAQFITQFEPAAAFNDLREQYSLQSVRSEKGITTIEMMLKENVRLEMEQEAAANGEDIAVVIPRQVLFSWDAAKGFCRNIVTRNAKRQVISTLEYQDVQINAVPDTTAFTYAPPEGVQVVDMTALTAQRLAAVRRPAGSLIGRECPDFTLLAKDRTQKTRADYDGKVMVIIFLATTSPACREALPLLDKAYRSYKNDAGTAFFSVSKEERRSIDEFMRSYGITVPALADPDGVMSDVFGVDATPWIFVVDKEHTIVQEFRGFQPGQDKELEDALRRLRNR